MGTQNFIGALLAEANTNCRSEAQLYTLYILLMGNILLVLILTGLPQALRRVLQRIQSHSDIEGRSSNFEGGLKRIGVFSAFPNMWPTFTRNKSTVAPEEMGNEIDSNELSRTKDQDVQKEKESQWYCVGASVQGTSHKDAALPCQDAHRFHHLSSGTLIITVADGVGSATLADEGANLASDVAIKYLITYLEQHSNISETELENALRNAYQAAVDSIQAKATREGVSASDYATTLTVGVITDTFVIGAMVGDGMMVVEDMRGEFSCVFELPKREYANQVVAITSPHGPDALQIVSKEGPAKTVSILTDGLLRLSCDIRKNVPHTPFFQAMTSLLKKVPEPTKASQELQTLLSHPSINERTDDDKTLVMAANIRLDVGEEGRSDDL
jgi:hypothetical protein